jgi:hypothetical protein
MARFLTMQRSIVPANDRDEFHKKMKERRAHFEKSNCKSWAFEEVGLAGAIIEFIESGSEEALVKALRSAPGSAGEYARIYRELEQS